MAFEIHLAKSGREHSELESFVKQLGEKAETSKPDRILYKQIRAYIKVVEGAGTRDGMPHVKFIGGDLWELRPGNVRIFFSVEGNKIVLLSHFIKKTNKTPRREIDKANRLLKKWRDEQL